MGSSTRTPTPRPARRGPRLKLGCHWPYWNFKFPGQQDAALQVSLIFTVTGNFGVRHGHGCHWQWVRQPPPSAGTPTSLARFKLLERAAGRVPAVRLTPRLTAPAVLLQSSSSSYNRVRNRLCAGRQAPPRQCQRLGLGQCQSLRPCSHWRWHWEPPSAPPGARESRARCGPGCSEPGSESGCRGTLHSPEVEWPRRCSSWTAGARVGQWLPQAGCAAACNPESELGSPFFKINQRAASATRINFEDPHESRVLTHMN